MIAVTRRIGAVAAVVALGLTLTSCGPSPESAGNAGSGESTLRVGLSAEPQEFPPAVDSSVVGYTLDALVHRGLMAYDNEGKLVQGLAESLDSDDFQSWKVVLRDGLAFDNGDPVTAEDVKRSLEYMSNPDSPGYVNDGLKDVESIDVASDTKLTIKLSAPNNAFLQYLAIPSAAIYPEDSIADEEDSWEGAGPFTVESYEAGRSMSLVKNEDYYDADNVALKEIELVFYPDGKARSNALQSGEVDLIDYVPWEDFSTIESNSDLVLDSQNGPFMYTLFNVEDGPFSDPLLRQAVAHAVNRQNTVDAAFSGNGEPLNGIPIAEDNPAYDPAWDELWATDMDLAKKLVEESGFDTSKEITLLTNSQYVFHQDVALSMQADLKALGLKVKMESPDWATRTEMATKGEYDILVNGNVGLVTDPAYMLAFLRGPDSPVRSHGYNNKDLIDLVDKGTAAQTDEGRKAAYDELREGIAKDVPFFMLNSRGQAHAYTANVKGFKTLPGFLSFYSGYSFAYVK